VRRKQNKKLSLDVAAYLRQMILARGWAEHHPTLSILPSLRRRALLLLLTSLNQHGYLRTADSREYCRAPSRGRNIELPL
jgi:hypothetical protein